MAIDEGGVVQRLGAGLQICWLIMNHISKPAPTIRRIAVFNPEVVLSKSVNQINLPLLKLLSAVLG
ncbi:hypothetical protein [Anabaena sp. CCY 0017]|uniref:hypothetical protein n=1 Tax=Anabaena sp. CCY 0017 TaxID=3103866 RepID=UPI0039C751BC